MVKFCIPKELSADLKLAAKQGAFTVQDLYEMNSKERRTMFSNYVPETMAIKMNAAFESAMISQQQDSLRKWVEKVFLPSEKKQENYKKILEKIDELEELGVLNPQASEAFYEDLVAEQLGVRISNEEVQQIKEKAEKLQSVEDKVNKLGLPTVDFWEARQDMENYILGLNPASNIKVASSVIGRGTLLASVKSPILNIVSNTAFGLEQALERRIQTGKLHGTNGKLAMDYIKYVNKVYNKTGYDVSRMKADDTSRRIRGEKIVHSQGKGALRKVGRFYEDIVFRKLMGAPDVASASAHFADTVSIGAMKLAQSEGLKGQELKNRSAEIFLDSIKIDPDTVEGEVMREQGRADAEYSTYTNSSVYSDVGLGIRNVINTASGDLRLGDHIMPFVKTPANVIGAGIDISGGGAIRAFYNLPSAIQEMRRGNMQPMMKKVVKPAVRSGLGLTMALVLSTIFDEEDFIGAYPTTEKERALLESKNAVENSIRIGDKWVSTEYFGPIAAPFMGMMYAKKYKGDTASAIGNYVKGVGTQLVNFPGFDQVKNLIKEIGGLKPGSGGSGRELAKKVTSSALDFISSRVIPSIVYDIAKATDPKDRIAEGPIERLKKKIPGLREDLHSKIGPYGETVKTEDPFTTILFGARVKTVESNRITNELDRLDETGNLPSLSRVAKTSTRVKKLEDRLPSAEYRNFLRDYGFSLKKELNSLILSKHYQSLSDEEKADEMEDVRSDLLNKKLKKYKNVLK